MVNFDAVPMGARYSHSYVLTEAVYRGFIDVFGDTNELHVNDSYARERGFKAKVMHGNIINGFISHFVGMVFPAGEVVIHHLGLDYKSPSYLGDELVVEAVVDQKIEAVKTLVLKITVTNKTEDKVCAKGRLQVGVFA